MEISSNLEKIPLGSSSLNQDYDFISCYFSGNTILLTQDKDGSPKAEELECSVCAKKGRLFLCMKCLNKPYCSSLCSTLDWPIHSEHCTDYKYPRLKDFCFYAESWSPEKKKYVSTKKVKAPQTGF